MNKSVLLWVAAFLVTAATAVYQRTTGPTYPLTGSQWFDNAVVDYRFERSHGGSTGAPVIVSVDEKDVRGTLVWKRYKSRDEWMEIAMTAGDGELKAVLPPQPPAGKLLYQVRLQRGDATTLIPPEPVVLRYKGEVPLWVLIPHVLVMFSAMLFSTRTGLEFFRKQPSYETLIRWTLGLLFAGGLILGPLVQLYAFDALWTGWPFGTDLTDNKTAVAFLIWAAAYVALKKARKPGSWILAASVVMLIVFLIPHSLLGSELDYTAAADPGS